MDPRQRVTRALAVALLALSLTGCTSTEVLDFLGGRGISIDQPTADAVAAKLSRPDRCDDAIRMYWPADLHDWAMKITTRESGEHRGVPNKQDPKTGRWTGPKAQNPGSRAAGCMQMLGHDDQFRAVGCSFAADKYDAACNVQAAWQLYLAAGKSPWSLTNY